MFSPRDEKNTSSYCISRQTQNEFQSFLKVPTTTEGPEIVFSLTQCASSAGGDLARRVSRAGTA